MAPQRRTVLARAAVIGLGWAGLPGWAPPAAATMAPGAIARLLGEARLSGSGRFTWFGLTIYEAQLWVGPRGLDASRFTESPFALDLRYARALGGRAIADASIREIAALGVGSEAERASWLDQMQRVFPDVRTDDRITGIHRPRQPVSFLLNDRPIGEIPDPGFAAAFFAIWLDARTRAPQLREAMLAGANPTARASAR